MSAPATAKKPETKLIFEFSSMKRAYGFENALRELRCKAWVGFRNGVWLVETNTDSLVHASKLLKLIEGGAR